MPTLSRSRIINEAGLQAACIRLFATLYPHLWDSCKLLHVPNGGSRNKIEAANLKRQGVVAGTWDLVLLIPAGGYSALWIEMKWKSNSLTAAQKKFRECNRAHYAFAVCYTQEAFLAAVGKYLAGGGGDAV